VMLRDLTWGRTPVMRGRVPHKERDKARR
jgi:hypothetical protein